MEMKPEIRRYDVLKLLIVAPKPLRNKQFLTSSEEEYHNSPSLMKLCVLALVIIGLITFYSLQPKPISLIFWIINTCLLLAFILYMYFIWGKPILFPTFILELNNNKVHPGDEVRVNFTTKGDLSLIQEFTVSLVLQERIIQEYELLNESVDYVLYKKHDAYRDVLHQSAKVDVTDLSFIIPRDCPVTLQTKRMQMVNVQSVKMKNSFTDMSRNVNLFLEWSILIEAKAKSGPLLRRYYFFTVYPFEENINDNKNSPEYF